MIKLKYLEANNELVMIVSDETDGYTVHEYFKTPDDATDLVVALVKMIGKNSKTDLEWK